MGGRAVEGTGLENQQACERLVGSNPTPSAKIHRRCPDRFASRMSIDPLSAAIGDVE